MVGIVIAMAVDNLSFVRVALEWRGSAGFSTCVRNPVENYRRVIPQGYPQMWRMTAVWFQGCDLWCDCDGCGPIPCGRLCGGQKALRMRGMLGTLDMPLGWQTH